MKILSNKRGSTNLIVLLFLLFILVGGFTAGLIILTKSQGDNEAENTKEGITAYQDQTTEYYAEKALTQANEPDWNITYEVPTCYAPEGEGGLTTLGNTNIYWSEVKEGEVKGTQIASDPEIVFTGTIDGHHLTLTDNKFGGPDMIEPFKITADFNQTLTEFSGTYSAQYNLKGVPYPGCPTDGKVSGPVSAKPIE